jgi:hypothetical protein
MRVCEMLSCYKKQRIMSDNTLIENSHFDIDESRRSESVDLSSPGN